MTRVFVDLDGVLADFDGAYLKTFGMIPDKSKPTDKTFWKRLASVPKFYRDLPLLPDAETLIAGIKQFDPAPVILSGIPASMPYVADEKRAWVTEHFGSDFPLITGFSKDKRKHGKPGDILIDDWAKYRHLWEGMGGIFILHTSAAETLTVLAAVFGGSGDSIFFP